MTEGREHKARTVFFHLGGSEKDIERPRLEKLLHGGASQFGRDVVKVGLDLGNFVGRIAFRFSSLTEDSAEHIRAGRCLACSQAVARALDLHVVHGAETLAEFDQQGGSRRRDEFRFLRHLTKRNAGENFECCGCRERKTAMGTGNPAGAFDGNRRFNANRAERMNARTGRHDVRYGIRCTDFMKSHLIGGNPMDPPFGDRDPVKDGEGAGFNFGLERGVLQKLPDVAIISPVDMTVFVAVVVGMMRRMGRMHVGMDIKFHTRDILSRAPVEMGVNFLTETQRTLMQANLARTVGKAVKIKRSHGYIADGSFLHPTIRGTGQSREMILRVITPGFSASSRPHQSTLSRRRGRIVTGISNRTAPV